MVSRVAGLAREMIIGARFGTSAELDAYQAAFRVPDLLFQLVAGGALGIGLHPRLHRLPDPARSGTARGGFSAR